MAKRTAGSFPLLVFACHPGVIFKQTTRYALNLASGQPDTGSPAADQVAPSADYWRNGNGLTPQEPRSPSWRLPALSDSGGGSITDFDRYPLVGIVNPAVGADNAKRYPAQDKFCAAWRMMGTSSSIDDARNQLTDEITRTSGVVVMRPRPSNHWTQAYVATASDGPVEYPVPAEQIAKWQATGETLNPLTRATGDDSAPMAAAMFQLVVPKWQSLVGKIEAPEWKLEGSEPTIAQLTHYSGSKIWMAARTASVTGDKWFQTEVVQIPLIFDDVARRFYMAPDYSEVGGAFAAARTAQRAYNDSMKKAIAERLDGKVGALPVSNERPAATTDAGLTADERKSFDEWWDSMEKTRAKVNASTTLPTEDQAFANYTAAGGTKNKTDWLADRATRVAAATVGDSDSSSWLSKIGSGLGQTADFVTDNLGKLGTGVLDLLKSWGPTGTVGAYAGVKAVNSVGGDTSKLITYGALALGALFLLK